jgi:hypothetical protein
MNYTISFTDFRKRMGEFSDLVKTKGDYTVMDEKRRVPLFKIVKAEEKSINWVEYMKFVEKLGGSGFLASKEDDLVREKFRRDINKKFEKARTRKWMQ